MDFIVINALSLRKVFEKEWLWQGKLGPTETFYGI